MSRITRALLAAALLALALPAGAGAAPTLVPVGSFNVPMYVASPPGDASRLFVVERAGVVRVVRDGTALATPVLTIPDVSTAGERGLLSIAFAPDYATSGLFYVYLAREPDGRLEVREYRRSAANPDVADPAGRTVWFADHPGESNHNGGTIAFGRDGYLWLATGDGGGQNDVHDNAQNPARPLGKLLRIDPHPGNAGAHTIPAGSPFGNAVWSVGLRNPFRFSFDRITGDVVIGDVGGAAREEIDFARFPGLGSGANYGWPCREGLVAGPRSCPGQSFTDPVAEYSTGSPRAVTGGVVVRDPGLPTLVGRYLYADYYDGVVRSLALGLPRATDDRPAGLATVPNLGAFGEDACGHVYVVSNNGTVSRVQDGALGPCVRGFAGTTAAPPPAGGSTGTPGPPDQHLTADQHPRRPQGPRRPPRHPADPPDRERELPRDDHRAAGEDEPQARPHPAPRRAPDRGAAAAEGQGDQEDPARAAPPQARDDDGARDRGRRGRQHQARDEAAEAAPGLGIGSPKGETAAPMWSRRLRESFAVLHSPSRTLAQTSCVARTRSVGHPSSDQPSETSGSRIEAVSGARL